MSNGFYDNIKVVYNSFSLPSLDDKTVEVLTNFMAAYNKTLFEHLNSEVTVPEVTERLKVLTGPIQLALSTTDDGYPHPAADFIKNKMNEQSKDMEKPFTKVLANPTAPSLISSDDMNGFSFAIILVCFTIVLGMVLGALLFILK